MPCCATRAWRKQQVQCQNGLFGFAFRRTLHDDFAHGSAGFGTGSWSGGFHRFDGGPGADRLPHRRPGRKSGIFRPCAGKGGAGRAQQRGFCARRRGTNNSALPFELRQAAQRFPVTLYAGAQCAPCDSARSMLVARGVPFTERTVASNEDLDALRNSAAAPICRLAPSAASSWWVTRKPNGCSTSMQPATPSNPSCQATTAAAPRHPWWRSSPRSRPKQLQASRRHAAGLRPPQRPAAPHRRTLPVSSSSAFGSIAQGSYTLGRSE